MKWRRRKACPNNLGRLVCPIRRRRLKGDKSVLEPFSLREDDREMDGSGATNTPNPSRGLTGIRNDYDEEGTIAEARNPRD